MLERHMRTVAISGIKIDMRHHRPMPDFLDGVVYQIVEPWYEQLKETYPANVFDITQKPLYLAMKSLLT